MSRWYITVAIPYVNAPPHLGYALELVQADALARTRRLAGDEVRFLGGTDDHALKNVLAAEAAGVPVAEHVKTNAARFEALAEALDISFDDFISTSRDPRHRPTVERLWRQTQANGDFYPAHYEGHYCVGCEEYYSPDELVDGCCPEHLTPAAWVSEENWFFRLSAYQERLADLISSGELRIEPSIFRTEALAFIRSGLADISVSRSRRRARGWGIEVPGDPSQVVYVWWDALANYVSALGYGQGDGDYERWWEQSDERVHVIGKGILRFHAVYWPALLLSAGLPLPTRLYVHPYLTADGRKLSKSTGHVVDPLEVVARFGTDPVRWWLLSDVPRLIDADFTEARLVSRANADLAGGIGNLISRTAALSVKPADGESTSGLVEHVLDEAAGFDLRTATELIRDRVGDLNRRIDRARPWETRDVDVLDGLVRDERELVTAVSSFVPGAATRLRRRLDGEGGGPLIPRLALPEAVHADVEDETHGDAVGHQRRAPVTHER